MSRTTSILVAIGLVTVTTVVVPCRAGAQAVTAADREAIVRLHVDRGGRAEDVDGLVTLAEQAASEGLPAGPLLNKIREGLAKGVPPPRIEPVVRQMAAALESADVLLRELIPAASADRETAVTMLGESIGGGITPDEIRALGREMQVPDAEPLSAERLAGAARGLAFIKDAELPVDEGTAVVAEAARRSYRAYEMLDLGREVKRREDDYRAGRATLEALREAISRGERPERLFRDMPPGVIERPAATRPEPTVERPVRPETPERPERPELPEVPTRPGAGR